MVRDNEVCLGYYVGHWQGECNESGQGVVGTERWRSRGAFAAAVAVFLGSRSCLCHVQ